MAKKKNNTTNMYVGLIWLIFGSLVVACTSIGNRTSLASETPQAATASPTLVFSRNTPMPQDTSTLSIPFYYDESCWPVRPLAAKSGIHGSLVFLAYGTPAQRKNPPFYWDIDSFQAQSVPGKNLWDDKGALSWDFLLFPSENSLIYFKNYKLTLASPMQMISKDVPLPPGNYSLGGDYSQDSYIKDGKFIFRSDEYPWEIGNKNYQQSVGFTDLYYVYDPVKGDLTQISTFLPRFTPNSRGAFPIAYSPDMRYVVYHSFLSDQEGESGFTLLDISTQKTKWTIPESHRAIGPGDDDIPIWKLDSSGLIYASNAETKNLNLYFISVDGKITQLTQFETAFKGNYSLAFFNSSSWSPNLQYFVFRAEVEHLEGIQLLIWDDKGKKLLHPCLPVNSNAFPLYHSVWSPNGDQIQVSLPYTGGTPASSDELPNYIYRQLILDIPSRTIFEIPGISKRGEYSLFDGVGNYDVLGWINWEIP